MTRSALLAFTLDALLVIAFAALGRASHESDAFGLGLITTAWPFVVALVVGWLVLRAWRRPAAPVRSGLGIWAITVAGGMLLRVLSGQGTALPFVIVATLTLLFLLVGWRLIAAAVRRPRRARVARSTQTSPTGPATGRS
ncbi:MULTISPECIES: DUF3054 domain-containing protein [unclassified Microbacterium]|uniref:DUF3054 domain-containing protein n=1 Tax=unclassified Microbacterium TaxID=2609290 RepID=UPI00214CB276|nr:MULTISPECIES: DUF3054 domain-containing protein [unclassified Microbacterium]MCR2783865.1 DUF3054 domain-containing protein [Microbacterium sp. zg.B96]WIM15289.1 DUF3054 domain-containing protein [Microbacterium sp. zg-B96]